MARRRLIENIASLGALQAATYLLPLLTVPYLARILGPENLGRIAFAIAFAQLFVILTECGSNLTGARQISVHRDDPEKVAEILFAVTVIRAAIGLAGFLVLAIVVTTVPRFTANSAIYFAAYAMVLGAVLFPQWLFQGLERLKLVSVIQIAARCLGAAAIFLFVRTKDDLLLTVVFQSAATVVAGLLTLPLVVKTLRGVRPAWPSRAALTHQLREGWHIFVSQLASNSYTTSSAFILGLILAPAAVGYYSVAEKFVRALTMMFGPITQAVYPHVSKMAEHDSARALEFNRKLLLGLGGLALLLSTTLSLNSGWLIRLLFGPAFAPAAPVLATLAFLPLCSVVSNVLGVQTMIPFGMKDLFRRVLTSAAVLNVFVFVPLAWRFGAQGAAAANVMVEAFVTVSMFTLLHSRDRNPMTFSMASK